MSDFSCFGCGAASAPKTTVCRECSIASGGLKKEAFHDFCEACFEKVERTIPFNDRLEYILVPATGQRTVVFRFCPTKERLVALRLMR